MFSPSFCTLKLAINLSSAVSAPNRPTITNTFNTKIAKRYFPQTPAPSSPYPFVTSNIIGATTMEQLKENIDSIDVTLSNDILKEIEDIHLYDPNPCV